MWKNNILNGSIQFSSPKINFHYSIARSVSANKTLTSFVLFAISLLLTGSSAGNWIRPEVKKSVEPDKSLKSDIEKRDSVPEGVTKEWLNSLRDENGNRIITESNSSREIPEDPESDAMQRKIFNGFASGDGFGEEISSAGDVNGDGYDDIMVSARFYNSNTGRVYIYYGGALMNTVPDVIMTGEAINSSFGFKIKSAGDVNGDGYDDVIIGAFQFASNTGRAYIFFGGQAMNGIADVVMTGESAGIYFGGAVSSAGDVNGDGYSDVIVGAQNFSLSVGRAYIFFGGAAVNNTADITMTGDGLFNYFGTAVSSAGDINADGYSDVIVGAHDIESAYIFIGGAAMNNVADVVMTGGVYEQFGASVSTAGDVNGDGYSDVLVGAYDYSGSMGRAHIFYGGTSMDNTPDVVMTGEAAGNLFGYSVSSAGDINGDGYSDVIIGARGYISNTGRAYIFFGGVQMNNVPDVRMAGETINNYFGGSVSSAGDVNGDGYPDVIAGASGYSSNTGRVYLYDYFMKNGVVPDLSFGGTQEARPFGSSVSEAGDFNGDGYDDIMIGALGYEGDLLGRAFIYFGGAYPDSVADVVLTGVTYGDNFGYSVSGAGDVNGDGYSDVIVGAYGQPTDTGKAYVYFGGAFPDNFADIILIGSHPGDRFGFSVSSAGDFRGDGYDDLLIGAPGHSGGAGIVWLFYGLQFSSNALLSKVESGTNAGQSIAAYQFGTSVSEAGDVNGDGYDDFIVGDRGYSNNTGRAYIYLGEPVPNLSSADLILSGEAVQNYFGNSVSSAGDVNRDGFFDVIVGANGHNSNTGKAYIYFGGATMNNTSDVTITGENANDYFGFSVSTARDVNRDGYDDILIGASESNLTEGKAYIYFGGASTNNIADVTMTGNFGETSTHRLGYSVSSAGDLNGDGYSDVIVGSFTYIEILPGRSFVYLGSAISTKPILNYVRDVPNDQGGYVNLKWARSSFDVTGSSTITSYSVYRSYPPVGGNFSWEEVASVTAVHQSFYAFISPTPFDSGTYNTGNFFFKVRAKTSNVDEYWESAILSGRSIDNVPPPVVSVFTASSSGTGVITNWSRNNAPDLQDYVLFRSVNPSINPYTEPVFASTNDSTYIDTSPLTGVYYYFIVAQDVNGNYSPVSVAESPNITLNLTMFIQGFYNPESNEQTADSVTVELRDPVPPFAVVDRASSVVSENGTVRLRFGNAADGNYYISVRHRNSIETWNASPLAFSRLTPVDFDLSFSSTQAFGGNLKQVDSSPVRFAVYSGDVNRDGAVDATDLASIDIDASNFVTGYVNTDLTGDEAVDATDAALCDNNAANFVSVIVP